VKQGEDCNGFLSNSMTYFYHTRSKSCVKNFYVWQTLELLHTHTHTHTHTPKGGGLSGKSREPFSKYESLVHTKIFNVKIVSIFDDGSFYCSTYHVVSLTPYRSASQHRFWVPSEVDEENENQDVLAESRSRYISFPGRFTPVSHHCNAPLGNGKMCSRQDRVKVMYAHCSHTRYPTLTH